MNQTNLFFEGEKIKCVIKRIMIEKKECFEKFSIFKSSLSELLESMLTEIDSKKLANDIIFNEQILYTTYLEMMEQISDNSLKMKMTNFINDEIHGLNYELDMKNSFDYETIEKVAQSIIKNKKYMNSFIMYGKIINEFFELKQEATAVFKNIIDELNSCKLTFKTCDQGAMWFIIKSLSKKSFKESEFIDVLSHCVKKHSGIDSNIQEECKLIASHDEFKNKIFKLIKYKDLDEDLLNEKFC